jgi:hypothetical protein
VVPCYENFHSAREEAVRTSFGDVERVPILRRELDAEQSLKVLESGRRSMATSKIALAVQRTSLASSCGGAW